MSSVGDLFPWVPQGPTESDRFKDFAPVRVLEWYDGPRLFTVRENGITYIAYLCSESSTLQRYLVVPSSDERVEALTTGSITLLQALQSPVIWVLDVGANNARTVRRVSWSTVPATVVPKPHVLLSRNLEPIFRVYVEGATLSPSAVTASLLKKYVENSYLLLYRFFEQVDWHGGFDPPVQQLALGSIMLSYGTPGGITDDTKAKELRVEFEKRIGVGGDPQMVQAIAKMCPFITSGPADSVTLSGQLVQTNALVLVRGARAHWNAILQNVLQLHVTVSVSEEGNVEEIDGGRGTFTLRDIDAAHSEIRCRADETIISELREAFAEGFPRIRIFGTRLMGEALVRVDRYEFATRSPPKIPEG